MSLLTTPPRLPLIAPSILAANFARLGEDCEHVLGAGADLLHLDVMDGHFVPNLTIGPALCESLRRVLPGAYLDVHLMVTDPGEFVEPFAKAGANHISFHVEAVRPAEVEPLVQRIRRLGADAGLVINPPTPVERILPFVSLPDLILVMSVNPGFGGQRFIPEVLSKVRTIKDGLRANQRLQMDGGINVANAADVRAAGCDVLVAGAALLGRPNHERAGIIAGLRGEVSVHTTSE